MKTLSKFLAKKHQTYNNEYNTIKFDDIRLEEIVLAIYDKKTLSHDIRITNRDEDRIKWRFVVSTNKSDVDKILNLNSINYNNNFIILRGQQLKTVFDYVLSNVDYVSPDDFTDSSRNWIGFVCPGYNGNLGGLAGKVLYTDIRNI